MANIVTSIYPASRKRTLGFVVLVGVVSLFADMTYEGARSITGPFMGHLGASGAVVSTVSGLGELVGYVLRLISGVFADRSKKYWPIVIVGYLVNVVAVPLLALASHWEIAAALIVAERTGKAIRTPARDALLSYAGKRLGGGWAFGLHEALDQTGATVGPLIVAGILAARSSYPLAFATLLVPALLTMAVLITARLSFPQPQDLDPAPRTMPTAQWVGRSFWIYLAAAALVAAAYADFPLIAFHFHAASTLPEAWIPTLYSLAMASAGLSALAFGRLYDRHGLPVLALSTLIAAFFAPLVFLGGLYAAIFGMLLWGIGLGAHESILRAAIAAMVPPDRRASAYGLFNMVYGIAWFAGSIVLGWLYDTSPSRLVVFSLVFQFAAIPLFLSLHRKNATVAP